MSPEFIFAVNSGFVWKTICTSRKTARNYSLRKAHRWKILLEKPERRSHARRIFAADRQSANVNRNRYPFRTLITNTGRKHAMQVPPTRRTLGYTIPLDP